MLVSPRRRIAALSAGTIRSRLIPALAVTLVVAMLALLGWAMFAPKSETVSQDGRIDAPGVFVPIKGRTAPNFDWVDFSGQNISLKDFRGKTVVLNFWASWCDSCKAEAPLLSHVAPTLDSNKTVILGIDALDARADGQQFMQQYGLTFRSAFDANGSVAVDYGISGMPETFIISPSGKLVGKFFGAITKPEQVSEAVAAAEAAG